MRHPGSVIIALALMFCAPPLLAAINVFTCEPEWKSLVDELGGESVTVYSATTAMQDPHRVEARPSLIARVRQADLVVCTGGGLEAGWLPVLLRQSGNPQIQPGRPGYIAVADHVETLGAVTHVDRAMGDVHPEGNPHFHLDPRRIAAISTVLASRLIDLDANSATYYRGRYDDFSRRWQAAIQRWETSAEPLRNAAIIVHHKDWVYFAEWLNLREVAALEPLPGLPPTVAHLAGLKSQYSVDNVLAIVRTPYQDARGSRWLNKQTGIPAVVLPYTVGGAPRVDDLFSLFEESIRLLLEISK